MIKSTDLRAAPRHWISLRSWLAGPLVMSVALCLILGIALAIRVRLLDLPLERDEGEYAYMGQLLMQGTPPYREACNMKWPGTYFAYAAIMAVFGQSPAGIHLGVILVNLTTSLLLFVLARRIIGTPGALVAAGFNALVSLTQATLGLAGHATHFVIVFALGGLVLLTDKHATTSAWRLFAAGMLFGLATLMKQAGAVFGLFAVGWLIWRELTQGGYTWQRLARQLAAIICGGVVPLAATACWLWQSGVWHTFWLWTVVYAKSYATMLTFAEGLGLLETRCSALWSSSPGLWTAAALGAICLIWHRPLFRFRAFILGFAVLSFVGVCPGLYFREHYFLLFLPAAGLLAGAATRTTVDWIEHFWPHGPVTLLSVLLMAGATSATLWHNQAIFFQLTPVQACRVIYGANPFPESLQIGRYLREHTPPNAQIAVIGSEPQIYFYAQRRSATKYLYTYPLQETQALADQMQQEFTREIDTSDPKYVVYVNIPTSWLPFSRMKKKLADWFTRYNKEHLEIVGLIEIWDESTEYSWYDKPTVPNPRSPFWIAVFRNKGILRP